MERFLSYKILLPLITGLLFLFSVIGLFAENHTLYIIVIVLIPLAALILLLFIKDPKTYLALILFSIPLSFNFEKFGSTSIGLSFPLEPLLFLMFGIVAFNFFTDKLIVSKRFILHPVSIVIFSGLLFSACSSITSEFPLISFKFVLSRLLYIVLFFVLAGHYFLKDPANTIKAMLLYICGFALVMLYTLYKHSHYGLSKDASPEISAPFYSEHTIYSTCLVLVIPFIVLFISKAPLLKLNKRYYQLMLIIFPLALVALFYGYSRASWLSLFVGAGFLILLKCGLKFRHFILILFVIVGFVSVFFEPIYEKMKWNDKKDANTAVDHVKTVANLSNDESNLERINRWSCAYRMFLDRPIMGFGPATYEFAYSKYQMSEQTTRISSYTGAKGDAHSEYFTALAEQGIIGLILWLLHLFVIIYYGFKVFHSYAKNNVYRLLSNAAFIGIITYVFHAFVNDFIELDEFATLFWMFNAMILVADLKLKREMLSV